jgi:hypothetical protein
MSWSHFTTILIIISSELYVKFGNVTVSLHATDAFVRSLPRAYLGMKLHAAISLVHRLFVLNLPLICSVCDVHPNASLPLSV